MPDLPLAGVELVGAGAPPAADALDGTEVLHVVQYDADASTWNSRVTTTQDIADLGAAGTPSDATPAALGTAAPGVATAYSRGDHVHQAPTLAGLGGVPLLAGPPAEGELTVTGPGGTVVASGVTTGDFAGFIDAKLNKPGGVTVDGGIVEGTGTAGAGVAVSSTTIADLSGATSAVAGDLATHAGDATNPHAVTAAQAGALAAITATNGRVLTVASSGAAVAQSSRLEADLVAGPASAVASNLAGFNGMGGKTLQDSGISAASVSGHISSASNPHSVTAAQAGADPKLAVQTAHTASTLTLTDADHNKYRALNTASNSIAISIPNTLTFPFVWTARKSSASNSVTITTGAGLITPKASGTVPVTDVDAYITIFAESSTVAAVFVTVAT